MSKALTSPNSRYRITNICTTTDHLHEIVEAYQGFDAFVFDDCIEWDRCRDGNGYGMVRASKKVWRTHRLVMTLVLGRQLRVGECVLHTCDNPPCLNPRHLFVGTRADNNRDRDIKGHHKKFVGDEHPRARLSTEQVLEMRELRDKGWLLRELSDKYGLGVGTIGNITNGRTWQHLL